MRVKGAGGGDVCVYVYVWLEWGVVRWMCGWSGGRWVEDVAEHTLASETTVHTMNWNGFVFDEDGVQYWGGAALDILNLDIRKYCRENQLVMRGKLNLARINRTSTTT